MNGKILKHYEKFICITWHNSFSSNFMEENKMKDSLLDLICQFFLSSYVKRYEEINPHNDEDIFLSDIFYC